jgi:hypothetical protein
MAYKGLNEIKSILNRAYWRTFEEKTMHFSFQEKRNSMTSFATISYSRNKYNVGSFLVSAKISFFLFMEVQQIFKSANIYWKHISCTENSAKLAK